MREIKFRGYDTDLKKWHYGNYYFYTDTIYCVASDKDHEENEHHCILFDGFCDWDMPRPHYKAIVDGKSISQYTGLKDKNGKEIYEGDIVEYKDFSNGMYLFKEQPKGRGVIKINNLLSGIYLKGMGTFEESKVEVIGNIYEKPELIQ